MTKSDSTTMGPEREAADCAGAPAERPKRPYRKPEIIEFGNVRELTQGTATSGKDKLAGRKNAACLPPDAHIATPSGDVAVRDLRRGMLVWTLGAGGERVAAPVVAIGSTPAPRGHRSARLTLADGRVVRASPLHPTIDGRPVGELAVGDALDGSTVVSAELVPFGFERTHDLLAAGPTGGYWSDGVLLGSTLLAARATTGDAVTA